MKMAVLLLRLFSTMQQWHQMDHSALEAISPVFSPMVGELKSSYQHRCVDALVAVAARCSVWAGAQSAGCSILHAT